MELFIESELKEFINRLPELSIEPTTVHLLMLAIRSRKAKEILGIKIKDLVVERRIVRPSNWKDKYFKAVHNLALLQHHGLYHYKDLTIPLQAKAIYCTLTPRSVKHAVSDLMKETINYIMQGDDSAKYQLTKLDVRYFGCLHRHKSKVSNYVTLDIDNSDKRILNEILDMVSSIPIFMVTETSRGYHVVLDLTKTEDAVQFYGQEKLMQKLGLKYAKHGLEIQRDAQEPVPGTLYFKENGVVHYVRILI